MTYNRKIELVLDGLNCASCAAKMERKIMTIANIRDVSLNFATKTLTVQAQASQDIEQLTEEIRKIVNGFEPLVVVKQKNSIEPGIEAIDESRDGEAVARRTAGGLSDGRLRNNIIRLITGAGIFFAAIGLGLPSTIELLMFAASYLLVGGDIIARAAGNIKQGQVFDENFLMSISTIGAFAIGEYPEGVAVMLFFQFGELLQDSAVNKSRKSISELMNIRPDYANLKAKDEMERVSPEMVEPGDIIVVKPGERVPLDGVVADGTSYVDTSALTGESVLREIGTGDDVLSGFINKNGRIEVKVTRCYAESTVSRILDLVENAGSRKARMENFITKFARYYTPAVVFAALAIAVIPPLVLEDAVFADWLYRGLIFLVVSCPCALVVSVPLGFFGGIGSASRNGILVKGGNYLEALNQTDTVVFDKTGTLTKGEFEVERVYPEDGITREQLIEYAALAESNSNHPIAQSIIKAYQRGVNRERIESYDERAGYGVEVIANGKRVLAGNARMMEEENVAFSKPDYSGTVVYVAVNGDYAGCILIGDVIKEDAAASIRELKTLGIRKVVMLTGDNGATAERVAAVTGIDEFYACLLPDQKVDRVEELEKGLSSGGKLVFVGDGINDAPVLARSDIGVAMGGLGSDAAIEAADIVLMTDEPRKLADAIRIARRTRSIVWQNIVFALGIKGVVMILGAAGMATMWEAVFADVGVAVIAVLNSLRTLYYQ